jgi:hypothetical protein
MAVVPMSTGGLDWTVADVSGTEVGTGTFMGGSFLSGDVVRLRENLIAVGAQSGGFTLFRLGGASGTPGSTPPVTTPLLGTVGSVSIASFDGRRVAVAAERSRVALAWLYRDTAAPSTRPGGWALLECSE